LPAVVLVAVVVIDGGAMCDDAWPCRWASALCAQFQCRTARGAHGGTDSAALLWQRGDAGDARHVGVIVVEVNASRGSAAA
jgi:hypothetical protein